MKKSSADSSAGGKPDSGFRFSTRCVRAGTFGGGHSRNRPISPPVMQSAMFHLGSAEEAEAIFSGAQPGFAYSRFGNPTVELLGRAIADLEGGAGGLVTASGNAAALCAVTAALDGRNGPLVTHRDIYGGSSELLQILKRVYRIELVVADSTDPEAWESAVSRAGAVLLETPSNPLMRLIDLEKTVALARGNGAPVIVDNTVATPFNQLPFEFGADWIVHSTSKFLNGHSDMIGGCVVKREPLLPSERAIHKNLGGTVNALEAWLVLRGLRTFSLRMEVHNRNGKAVAKWLRERPEVRRVNFPGLSSDPYLDLFDRQMKDSGALLSFELMEGEKAAQNFLNRIELIAHAVSLGGLETVATRPAMSSHRGMSPEERRRAGVGDGLIRLSVGLEALDDLLADLDRALN